MMNETLPTNLLNLLQSRDTNNLNELSKAGVILGRHIGLNGAQSGIIKCEVLPQIEWT